MCVFVCLRGREGKGETYVEDIESLNMNLILAIGVGTAGAISIEYENIEFKNEEIEKQSGELKVGN